MEAEDDDGTDESRRWPGEQEEMLNEETDADKESRNTPNESLQNITGKKTEENTKAKKYTSTQDKTDSLQTSEYSGESIHEATEGKKEPCCLTTEGNQETTSDGAEVKPECPQRGTEAKTESVNDTTGGKEGSVHDTIKAKQEESVHETGEPKRESVDLDTQKSLPKESLFSDVEDVKHPPTPLIDDKSRKTEIVTPDFHKNNTQKDTILQEGDVQFTIGELEQEASEPTMEQERNSATEEENGNNSVAASGAASEEDVEEIDEDYEKDITCDAVDGGALRKAAASKQTLHEAALHNNVERIRTLLQHKADVNAKDKAGYTPLFYALRFKKDELTITLLIQAGADINGTYALHDVAGGDTEESVKVAQLLLDSGADIAAVDLAGRIPLFYAAERGTSAMVELLLQHQSPIYVLDNRKETPLCVALKRRNMDILSLIFGEHHVQIFQEDHLSKRVGSNKKLPLEDLLPVEESKSSLIPISSASAPNLRDLKQPSGLEHFFSEQSLKYADDVDSSQRNSYIESIKSQTSNNTTKHKRQVSFHTMSEICKDKGSKPQNPEEYSANKKKHRRKLSQDLRYELDNARIEAMERGKAAGSRLKRKSKEDELDLYIELIENECLLHRTVPDIKACLRLGLGPNKTTQAVVNVIDGDCCCQRVCNGVFNKPIEIIRNAFRRVTTSGHFAYLVYFLLPLILYYSDLIVDIVLAFQLITLLNAGAAIIVISWILVIVPSTIANILLFQKRKYLLTKDMSELNTKAVYNVPHFKPFLIFYNTLYFSVLLAVVHGWPGLLFYQYSTMILNLKKPFSPVDQVRGHKLYIEDMLTQFVKWCRLLQDTLQLVLQLCVALNVGRITSTLSVKVFISCMVVSYGLVKEEIMIKSPAKISCTGSILLFLCFMFRFLHRIICIAFFVLFLTYWTIFVFLIHIAMVFSLQEYDRSVYGPKDSAFTLDRVLYAALSIFHYIPRKTYEHSTPSITRALFLASMLVEDFFMFFVAYLYREEIFADISIDYIMIKYLAIVTLFALVSSLFLAAYYKYGHPWKWRTQRCCLE